MAAPLLDQTAPRRLRGSSRSLSQQRSCVGMLLAAHRPVHFSHYSYDPGSLMNLSIARELNRLCRSLEFHPGSSQQSSSGVQSYLSSATKGKQHGARRRMRPSAAGITSGPQRRGLHGSVSSPTTPSSRRLVSPLSSSPRERWHPLTTAAVPHLTSTLSEASQDASQSRRRRKEEFIKNGLEPLQNFIGVGGCFLQRPHFLYRPLSQGDSGTRASTADLSSGTEHPSDVGARTVTQGTYVLPRSSSSRSGELLSSLATRHFALPLSGFPNPVVEARASHPFGDAHPFHCVDTCTEAAADRRAVNGAPSSSAASTPAGEAVQDSSGSHGGAFACVPEDGDTFFDEDPLASQFVQRPESDRWTPRTHATAARQAVRRRGKTHNQADLRAWVTPSLASLLVSSLPSSAPPHVSVPRASVFRANPASSLSSSAIGRPSTSPLGQSTSLPSAKPSFARILHALEQSQTFHHYYQTVHELLEQILRVRAQYESAMNKGRCPCGVCEDGVWKPHPFGRVRGTTAQGSPFSSSFTCRSTLRPHSRLGRIIENRRRVRSRRCLRDSQSSDLFEGGAPPRSHTHQAVNLDDGEPDVRGDALRGCNHCERRKVAPPRDRVVPVPPSRPQGNTTSAPRRGRRRPSSVASPNLPAGQFSSHKSENAAATQPTSHHRSPYYSGQPAHYRSSVPVSGGGDGRAREVKDDVALQSEAHLDTDDYHHFIHLLDGMLKQIQADTKGSDEPVTQDAASGAASGAPGRIIEALLRGLRAEAPVNDATYAALLRILHGVLGDTGSVASPEEGAQAAAPTGRRTFFPYNIPHPPLSRPSPHAPERCDAAVETATPLLASPKPLMKSNPSNGRMSSVAPHSREETPLSDHATPSEIFHSGENARRSPGSSAASSIDLRGVRSGGILTGPSSVSPGDTDTFASDSASEVRPTS